MKLALYPYIILYIISLVITTGVSIFCWQRRKVSSARKFVFVATFQSIWTLGNILEIISDSISAKIFWDNLQYIPMFALGIALLIFTLDYCGYLVRSPVRLAAWLSLFPIAFTLVVFLWSGTDLVHPAAQLIPGQPFSALTYEFSPLVLLSVIYTLGLGFVSVILLTTYFIHAPSLLRAQTGTILAGVLIPMISSVSLFAGISPIPQRDITPLAFAIGDMIIAWGFFHFKLFKFSPVARNTIFESLEEGVIVLDRQNTIVDLNHSAQKFLGCEFNAAIGKSGQEFLPFWDQLSSTEMENDLASIEFKSSTRQKYSEIRKKQLVYQNGQNFGKLITISDITAQKITAEMLTHRSNELEIANQALEEFAYSIAHDLRAPLRAMAGFSQILIDDHSHQLDVEGQELLQRIRRASQHMGILIDDLLLLSNISRRELMAESVNLSKLAAKCAANLQAAQPHREVEIKISPNLIVIGDPSLLVVAIENLFENAWKFTQDRSPAVIELGYTEIDSAPTYFVRDNGVGFDMAYASKLFKTFQRLHSPGEYEGIGTGLAIVERIIHQHRGRIWAESQEGEGATFYFTL